MFEVPIQAAVGKRIIARETLSALRADVTAGLYGGACFRKTRYETYSGLTGAVGQDITNER